MAQLAFSTAICAGHDVPAPPRVRLEVRESRNAITGVRDEDGWPLERTQWRPLYLGAGGLATTPPSADGQITFDARSQGGCWEWAVPADTEVTGPMALRLLVEAHGADDINLFAGVEKWHGHTHVGFEGSYGFGRDRITTGWLKASLRELDEQASRPFEPVPTCSRRLPLAPGRSSPWISPLGPSATLFQAGEWLRLVWPGGGYGRQPAHRAVPASYQKSPKCRCTLHWGPTAPGPTTHSHHSLTQADAAHQEKRTTCRTPAAPIAPIGTVARPFGPSRAGVHRRLHVRVLDTDQLRFVTRWAACRRPVPAAARIRS